MAPLLELPPELLVDILSRLERIDQKQFRLTSHECKLLATPLVFDEIFFDLEPGGCDGLTSIANSPSLNHHVQTVRLQRRAGLMVFTDFEGWRKSNIHEYIPFDFEVEDEPTSILCTTQTMSLDEWEAMDDDKRRTLYSEYESDLGEAEAYTSRLASAMSALLFSDSHDREQPHNNSSDARRILWAFIAATKALSNIHTLAHTPSYEYDNWGRIWRNSEFHPGGLVSYASYGIDPDMDALQLFIALRTTALVRNPLRSVELCTLGYAFWSVPHLRHLLDWSPRLSPRGQSLFDLLEEGLESWVDDIGGPLAVMKYTETITQELIALERSLSCLTCLKCRVNTLLSRLLQGKPMKDTSTIAARESDRTNSLTV